MDDDRVSGIVREGSFNIVFFWVAKKSLRNITLENVNKHKCIVLHMQTGLDGNHR